MTKEKWGFIDSRYCSPAFNMALDEALLNWQSKGEIPPIIPLLRAGIQLHCRSVIFQKAETEIDLEEVKRQGLGFVRRPTGGRAVPART